MGSIHPKYDAKREPTDLEIAWAAGVYEGEGSCHFAGAAKSVTICVGQNDPELLHRLAEVYGGSVRLRTKTGKHHVWLVHGERARKFYRDIKPWMTARRVEQLEKVFGP